MLSAITLDQLGAKMKCDRYGKRPERYYPAKQTDAPGTPPDWLVKLGGQQLQSWNDARKILTALEQAAAEDA